MGSPLNSNKLVMEVIMAKEMSVYTDAELEGESGAQQAPNQAFVLTEAVNGRTFA